MTEEAFGLMNRRRGRRDKKRKPLVKTSGLVDRVAVGLQSCGLHLHGHRTLPRAKKVSPGHFFALLRKAALFEPYIWNTIPKRKAHPFGWAFFWWTI